VSLALSQVLSRAVFPEGAARDVSFLVLIPVIEIGANVVLRVIAELR